MRIGLPKVPIPVSAVATKVAAVMSVKASPLVIAPVSAVKVTAPAPALALIVPVPLKVIAPVVILISPPAFTFPLLIVVVPVPAVFVTQVLYPIINHQLYITSAFLYT